MAKKRMLINVSEDETRIALTENDVLVDLHIEQVLRGRTAGNIYRGTVVKVNPAFQAAFVDYGEKKNGFLSISDLNPTYLQGQAYGKPRIQSILRRGQNLMVQVLKDGMGAKGAALTTNIAVPGRYLVLNPYTERSGVSRKIEEVEHRARLKEFLTGLAAEGLGVIVRTAGTDRSLTELKRDYTTLRREWKEIQERYQRATAPDLIYREPGPVVRVLRDYFSEDVEEVWVDSPEVYQAALEYFKSAMPKFQKRLKLYIGDRSLFSLYKIEEKIEALDSAKVPLKSGGSIVITPTEALVAIDVNSGKSNQESDIEETALRTNLEAAEEIARQLRLRNLGGLIVIDFIDMAHKTNQHKVTQFMSNALKHDKARTTLGAISQFGLLELSRQRIDMELSRGLRIPCDNCGGTGQVPTVQASANTVLRKLREIAAQGGVSEIRGVLPLEHANFLLNHKREYLSELELEFGIKVHLFGDSRMPSGQPVRLESSALEPAAPTEPRVAEEPAAQAEQAPLGEGEVRRRRRRHRRRGGLEEDASAEMPGEPRAAAESLAAAEEDWDEERAWAEEAIETLEEPEEESAGEDLADQEEPRPADVHEPAPDSAISLSHSLPTAFTLGRLRRPEAEIGLRAAAGEAIFQSTHREDGKEHETVLIPIVKRDDPFSARAQSSQPGQVFFESTHRGNAETDAAEGGSASGGEGQEGTRHHRTRGRRSRRGHGGKGENRLNEQAGPAGASPDAPLGGEPAVSAQPKRPSARTGARPTRRRPRPAAAAS